MGSCDLTIEDAAAFLARTTGPSSRRWSCATSRAAPQRAVRRGPEGHAPAGESRGGAADAEKMSRELGGAGRFEALEVASTMNLGFANLDLPNCREGRLPPAAPPEPPRQQADGRPGCSVRPADPGDAAPPESAGLFRFRWTTWSSSRVGTYARIALAEHRATRAAATLPHAEVAGEAQGFPGWTCSTSSCRAAASSGRRSPRRRCCARSRHLRVHGVTIGPKIIDLLTTSPGFPAPVGRCGSGRRRSTGTTRPGWRPISANATWTDHKDRRRHRRAACATERGGMLMSALILALLVAAPVQTTVFASGARATTPSASPPCSPRRRALCSPSARAQGRPRATPAT